MKLMIVEKKVTPSERVILAAAAIGTGACLRKQANTVRRGAAGS